MMTTIKTQDLTGAALDICVGRAIGRSVKLNSNGIVWPLKDGSYPRVLDTPFSPSTDWSQGGPIMARLMDMGFEFVPDEEGGVRCSNYNLDSVPYSPNTWESEHVYEVGPTPLIAACRAIVAAKLGDEVDVPEELV